MKSKSKKSLVGISAILLFYAQVTLGGYATLENNKYRDVVVGISKNLESDPNLFSAIQRLIAETSKALYNATGNRAYFGNVTVVGSDGFFTSGVRNVAKRDVRSDQWQPPIPSFDSADVRIDVTNAAYGDVPYTQQSRGCGEPGDFIHLTPSFVKNGEPTINARLLANEWIKYRYGVFDENGYIYNEVYPEMYYAAGGDSMYNMCNATKITWEKENCAGISQIQGLKHECTLIPVTNDNNKNVNSSMMSSPIIPVATRYCTNSDHNSDAPNKQNYMCSGRSIMDVVLQHPDFAGGKNSPLNMGVESLASPTVGGSITNNDIGLIVVTDVLSKNQTQYNMKPSLKKFIGLDFPINSYFGFIQNVENGQGTPYTSIVDFKQIINNNSREDAATRIQEGIIDSTAISDRKTTDIMATVQQAISILNNANQSLTKAILLISNATSGLSTICASAYNSGIQLHLLTFDSKTFDAFRTADTGCHGEIYYIQADTMPTHLDDVKVCYADMQRRTQLENALMNLPSTILPDKFERPTVFFQQMYTNTVTNGTIYVDAQVTGGETAFYVETCLNHLYGVEVLETRNLLNCTIGTHSYIEYNTNADCFVHLSSINAFGSYTFQVQNRKGDMGPVPFVVYSVGIPYSKITSGRNKVQVLQTEAWVTTEEVDSKWTKVRVFASVKNGTTPVFDANVTARITTSAGKPNSNITLTLVDDGSGNPDISAQDGIYSAYFTQFSSTTSLQYGATVTVTDNEGAATYPTTTYPWISRTNDMGLQTATTFQRTVQTNSFTARGASNVIPPGNVTNLRVKSIDGAKITLAWTAPGEDLDYGTATSYVFNCSTNRTDLDKIPKLDGSNTHDDILQSTTPQKAGTTETASFNGHYDQMVHYCALQAVDHSKNYGRRSNIVSYYLISGSTGGMSSATIAGVVVGVILGLIMLIAIIVLIWYCLAGRGNKPEKKEDPEDNGYQETSKLNPIPLQQPIPLDQRTLNQYQVDAIQNNLPPSKTPSMHSLAQSQKTANDDGNASDDEDTSSNYSRNTAHGMQTFQGKPVGVLPVSPSRNSGNYEMQPMGGPQYGSRPRVNDRGEPYDNFETTYVMTNADVAVPQRLAQLATIEDTGEYQDRNVLKGVPNDHF